MVSMSDKYISTLYFSVKSYKARREAGKPDILERKIYRREYISSDMLIIRRLCPAHKS